MNLNFWKKREEHADSASAVTDDPPPPVAEGADQAAPATDAAPAIDAAERAQLERRVIEAVSTVYDPEIPVNIYELGLVYDIEITPQADVVIEMTLTSPACPVAGSLPGDVEAAVAAVGGARAVEVHLVWDPPWTPDRMSEAAKLELGFM